MPKPPKVLPPDFKFDEAPQASSPQTLPPDFNFDQTAIAPDRSVTIGARPQPVSLGQKLERFGQDAIGDIKYGTEATAFGKFLKKIGAQPTTSGVSEGASNFMGSPLTGTARVSQGAGQVMQPGKRLQGAGNIAGGAAEALTIPGMMAAPEAAPVAREAIASQGAKVFGSVSRGSDLFEQVMAKAKNVPVNSQDLSQVVDRTKELANSGGSMPKVVRDFMRRMSDPSKGPITYGEARDFYSNATRLSADEFNRLTPVMQRQVGQFTAKLGGIISKAADTVGQGENYSTAMTMFRKGKNTENTLQNIGTGIKNYVIKPALAGAGLGAGYGVYETLKK